MVQGLPGPPGAGGDRPGLGVEHDPFDAARLELKAQHRGLGIVANDPDGIGTGLGGRLPVTVRVPDSRGVGHPVSPRCRVRMVDLDGLETLAHGGCSLPDMPDLCGADLRSGILRGPVDDLQALLAYEESARARAPFQTLLANRITRATAK